ncbi:TonB-dependent receptor plug domain-containing protein [Microbulbifer thermotolerans]|uniref:TonB-dependent receptor plug domain-containing protein n=1 Tax=Microbulbifer thermotolerans TaxID=252514 RepID=UPI0008EC1590|nr:TonB-dependent receptor [Microbulbifer thermotolerans]MCX2780909.1 TonB-dependent receptor [Microbulbifer thermotolerans]MCX2806635.1 TonB-dependent receptor [Microbulbifer thermotolerans]MCX2831521.1 TonB-dependent receptor [Microbulbifer thermotolerans]MCX2835592.1 TonB-dependent receptor [Microbulbifer thermotolerans]WKT59804.1 TonB-dependent receptor [Microbulbifer thermotolerans]
MKKNLLSVAVKGALGLTAAAVLIPAMPTIAQENATTVEEVIVTGSRIARDDFSSSSPISTYGSEDLDKAGLASIDEFLKEDPAFTGYQMGTSTNNGSDQGQKKIDMRGLGFNRTLVLINGRRTIGDVNGDGAVDINTVPEAMIERVEVLKDGASTIYGSDALAGVVNFVLKDDFEGFELKGNFGQGTEDGQAQNSGFSMLAGLGSDRGHMLMSLSYSQQDEMYQAERPWATEALYPQLQEDGTFKAVGSGSSNSRKITVPGVGTFIYDEELGKARPFTTEDVYNYAPVNALITPNKRWQFGAIGNVEITDETEGYFEALYTRRTSHQRLAPDASFAVTTVQTPNNGEQMNDFVPASNPYNPFGDNPANDLGISGQDVRVNRRFEESGGRLFTQTADTYRMVAGIRGDFGGIVDWDFSYTFAENQTTDETTNYGRFDRWAIAVDPDACAADPVCAEAGVLNPFGDYRSITQEQMDYLTAGSLKDVYKGRLEMAALNFSGDMFSMPGGTAGWALGLEHRHEQGSYVPDEFISGGLTTGGAGDPQEGDFSVSEVYGEIFLPVLDNLSFNASTRYSDYDTSAGSATTFKVGMDYQPINDLRVRAGISTGFRAPNISELNQGASGGFPIVEPICEFADRRLAAGDISQVAYDNCKALGINTTDAGELGFAWQSYYETSAPEKPLEPEESESFNLGFVYTPSFMENLSFSVDYWNIEIDNVIGAEDINDLHAACMNSVDLSSIACTAFIGGNPYLDVPVDSSDPSLGYMPYPNDASGAFGNLGTLRTDGFDFAAKYQGELSVGPIQGYTLSWTGTLVESYEREFPLAGSRELVGTANGFEVFPEWRWSTNVGIFGDNWTLDWDMRYIDETVDALRPASITDDAVAEDIIYHDLIGSYTWQNINFSLGINNVTDEDAPRFHSAFNANTEPGMYDVIGRRVFTGFTVTF